MSQFGRTFCGLCGTTVTHTRNSDNDPWECIHHSPARNDEWEMERAKMRIFLAGLNPFQLREIGDDVTRMLDYQANKMDREQVARLWIKGAA